MTFRRYEHLERLGHLETSGLTDGTVYVFPKLDGTNASVWKDDKGLRAGSRNRVLDLQQDNAGFCAWAFDRVGLFNFFDVRPDWILYGEWLVPHTIKAYRPEAWRRFWIFDVYDRTTERFLPWAEYQAELKAYGLDVIDPLEIIAFPTDADLLRVLNANTFMMQDGAGPGEGIVLKNYGWRNKFDRQVWGKIVRAEFKEENRTEFGVPVTEGTQQIEREIAEKYVTETPVRKTLAKINLETTEKRSVIPRLLHTVYYELIREELWTVLKELKNPTIDFKKLQRFATAITKTRCPELF